VSASPRRQKYFTTGNRTGWAGKDVSTISATDVLVLATPYATSPSTLLPTGFYFKAHYKEGAHQASFAYSYIELYPAGVGALDPTCTYTVSIDCINGIASLCGHRQQRCSQRCSQQPLLQLG
jgi:hypothetical protein